MPLEREELEQMLSSFKAEITETFQSSMKETLSQVDKKNGGTAASLTKEFQKTVDSLRSQLTGDNTTPVNPATPAPQDETPSAAPAAQDSSERLSLKALQNQIENLRRESEAKDLQLQTEQRNSAITSLFSDKKAQFADKATRAFLMENEGSLKHEDGVWYHAEGDNVVPLDKAVDNFLNTEFGQTFQPASRGRGMNMKPARGEQSAGKGTEVTLNESLLMPEAE